MRQRYEYLSPRSNPAVIFGCPLLHHSWADPPSWAARARIVLADLKVLRTGGRPSHLIFRELRFHAVGYPGGEVLPASTYKQLAFGTPQGGRPPLEETRLPCCSRTDGRSAAQSVRSFVTKASPPSKERRCSPSRKPCSHPPPRYPSPARDSFPEEGGVTATESPGNTEPVGKSGMQPQGEN